MPFARARVYEFTFDSETGWKLAGIKSLFNLRTAHGKFHTDRENNAKVHSKTLTRFIVLSFKLQHSLLMVLIAVSKKLIKLNANIFIFSRKTPCVCAYVRFKYVYKHDFFYFIIKPFINS